MTDAGVNWDELERTAYGLLELTPAEFLDLTPRELELMVDGYKDRERRKASYLQWLLAPHYQKKTPKLHELTGFAEDAPKKLTKEEYRADLKALMKELGLEGGGDGE